MSRIINIVARGKSAKVGEWDEAAIDSAESAPYQAVPEAETHALLSVPQLIERRIIALGDGGAARDLRKLRTELLQQMRDQQWRVLGITSPTADSGRAFFAANLAAAMAVEGQQRITLVDMDLRSPKLHTYFGQESRVGVREVLERRASPLSSLQPTVLEQLRVLPGSVLATGEPERFYGRELAELLPALLEPDNNQIIVVRLPPVLESTETQIYMPAMDCGLCVLKEGVNTPQQVEDTVAVLKQKAFMGVIFNRAARFRR